MGEEVSVVQKIILFFCLLLVLLGPVVTTGLDHRTEVAGVGKRGVGLFITKEKRKM